ncbi:MAG: sulfotransferase family protein [Planctomycetaceae bacterium]
MTSPVPLPPPSAAAGGHALVVVGMHRSGTSLLASLADGAGVAMGQRLMGSGNGNDAGHFEDLDFHDFHERALVGNGLSPEGFTPAAEPAVPEPLRASADALVADRRGRGCLWGWKDPRTVLFLDFWAEMLPEARFVFVFRSPWEVVDSFFRRGDPAFVFNPLLAARVWLHYNRLILRFVSRHHERCLVRETRQIAQQAKQVFAAIRHRLGVPVGEPPERYRPELLGSDADGRRAQLLAAAFPEAIEVYYRLCHEAGTRPPLFDPGHLSTAELAVIEWARAARLQRDNDDVRREWVAIRTAADAEIAAVRAQLAAGLPAAEPPVPRAA